ncbi:MULTISPECIES: type II toxin-antitoxin system antitoxin DNA ADP-ribosyl glycohydrolase DarG [Sporosarcina]|uniref:type II toxin-antitoxin system antitoxin DNA ADP-ribosyl glycohydrolase DarG n=1 Tax=Sporosarcina TaxID=1569 RepID=UPI00058B0AE7|nr:MULTISPECIES: macro domain-containing protein [Sporosarcina]WJY26612.1 macro domain-containing protein [Sporosarcina sp. 0.2-SM1T-5]
MIRSMQGNLLEDQAEAYVNTVNTVGVMGKGIALQFKQAFPDVFKQYAKDCKAGQVRVGRMHVVPVHGLAAPKYVINFPTKKHWRNPSELTYIQEGLRDLVQIIQELNLQSIAIPPLGCGNGGLEWPVVRTAIVEALAPLSIEVHLYEPAGAPPLDRMVIRTKRPNMTLGRALLISAMEQYAGPGYRMSLLEVQKLAYFLHEAGTLPKLQFEKNRFGPYAEALNHVLQDMEGHWIRGYGDRTAGAEIYLLEGAIEEAEEFLKNHPDAKFNLDRVSDLIYGFETPYDMELLATVHWVLKENASKATDKAFVVQSVQQWNERKNKMFPPRDIEQVWNYLLYEVKFAS